MRVSASEAPRRLRFILPAPPYRATMRSAFRLVSVLMLALVCAMSFADPATAAAAIPHAGPLVLSDPSWIDGFTMHVVGAGSLAAAVAVPKGTLAKAVAKLRAALGANATPTDEEIQAALAEELAETDPVVTPPVTPPTPDPAPDTTGIAAIVAQAVQAAVAPLQATVATLQGALETETTVRSEAQKAVQTQQAKERETAITTALDAAVKDGRIVPAKRDDWKTRLEADFDTISAVLTDIPANPALAKAAGTTAAKTGTKTETTTTERPAPGSMAGSVPSAAMDYVTANTN